MSVSGRTSFPARPAGVAVALDGALSAWDRGVRDYSGLGATILQLVEGIVGRRRARVTYQAPWRDNPRTFAYDPYRLISAQGGLYCVGWVPAHGNLTTLAVDRIRWLELTGEPFSVDRAFDPKRSEAEAFGIAWEKPMTVVVRFRADQAPYVREREWHPTQKIRELRDGRIELTFRAGGAFEIMRWILWWGDAAEVMRPASLRREVLAARRAAAAAYRRSGV